MRTLQRHRRLASVAASALGFIAIASGSALAQAQVPPEMRAQAMALAQLCHADFNRLCPGVLPGGGRILACLQAHASDLTPQCREAMPTAEDLKSRASEAGVLPR